MLLLMFVASKVVVLVAVPLFSEHSGRPPLLLHHTSCSFAEDNGDAPVALSSQVPPTLKVGQNNPD